MVVTHLRVAATCLQVVAILLKAGEVTRRKVGVVTRRKAGVATRRKAATRRKVAAVGLSSKLTSSG